MVCWAYRWKAEHGTRRGPNTGHRHRCCDPLLQGRRLSARGVGQHRGIDQRARRGGGGERRLRRSSHVAASRHVTGGRGACDRPAERWARRGPQHRLACHHSSARAFPRRGQPGGTGVAGEAGRGRDGGPEGGCVLHGQARVRAARRRGASARHRSATAARGQPHRRLRAGAPRSPGTARRLRRGHARRLRGLGTVDPGRCGRGTLPPHPRAALRLSRAFRLAAVARGRPRGARPHPAPCGGQARRALCPARRHRGDGASPHSSL
jgi:hypothetical protein